MSFFSFHAEVRLKCAFILLLFGASVCFGQTEPSDSNKGTIRGRVTDSKHAAVAGAQISLRYADLATLVIESDTDGRYSVDLVPGPYKISVTTPNGAEKSLEQINITAGKRLTIDVVLESPTTKKQVAPVSAGEKPSQPGGDQASIKGTVTDPSGAVLVGAKATLANGAGAKIESQSNDRGVYSFTQVAPGTYTLTVTAPNFAQKVFDNMTLTPGLELALDVPLDPSSEKTEVNVESSNVGKVETETATVSGTITEQEVVKIQLNGRNFSQLIALAPGVSNQTGQDEGKVGVLGSVKYSVNGGRVEYNSYEIDGSDVLNTGLNRASSTLMVYPSLDAVQEVKVLTSNYGAQYGRTASGTVQVTTKSGSADFHGNLYDFVRNEAFNSRNYFDLTSKAPLYRRQDFGGTIGGPLTIPHVFNTQKEKTFFFFSEEVRLEKTPTEFNQAVPGLHERGLTLLSGVVQKNLSAPNQATGVVGQVFDFSDVCPLQGTVQTFSRQSYPDCPGYLTTVGLNPVYYFETQPNGAPGTFNFGVDKNALAILNSNLIPLPNSATGCNYTLPASTLLDPTDPYRCYVASVSPSTYWREELFRIDQQIMPKVRASFRYIHDAWDTTVLAPQWNYLSVTNPAAATFPTIQNRFTGPGLDLVARFTHTISPSLVNVIDLSYSNAAITLKDENGPGGARFQRDPSLDLPLVVTNSSAPGQCNPGVSVDLVTGYPQCGMGYLFNNGFGGKMPGVAFLGSNAAYGGRGFVEDPSYMPWGHTNPTYAIRDDVGKSFGKHTLQFGVQYVYAQRNQDNNAIGAASGDLQGLLTFSNLANSTGNAFADFLVQHSINGTVYGSAQSFTQDSAMLRYYQRYNVAEPYIQDDWKVNSRLTLNLGVRLSLFGLYSEKNHNAWNWVASRYHPNRFAVDPVFGSLLDATVQPGGCPDPVYSLSNSTLYLGCPLSFNATTFQPTNPDVVGALGLVQCGVSGAPAGCMSGHLFNWAPRIGFAWDPKGDGKTSIRTGYGIFYEHGTGNEANTGSLEASAPNVFSVTQPLPTNFECIGGVGYNGFGGNPCTKQINNLFFAAPPYGTLYPIDVTSIPTKAIWPYAQQWSFGIQRELPRDVVLNLAYVGSKGTHLTVERQLNQLPPLPANENPFGPNEPLTLDDCTVGPSGQITPAPGNFSTLAPFQLQNGTVTSQSPAYPYLQAACANLSTPNVNSLSGHPYPGLGRILALQNVANSSYHAFQMTARHTRGPLSLGVSYSYSHSIDDSSDRSDPILVNSYDLAENRASSSFDERHLLTINYIYQLPLKNLPRLLMNWAQDRQRDAGAPPSKCCSNAVNRWVDGWELSGVTLFQSGTPFTVINSAGNTGISLTDNAGVSSGLGVAASYPDILRGQPMPGNNAQSFGPLISNPSVFVAPRGLTFGDAGRNSLNNPSRLNFDMALAKHFKVTEGSQIEFRAEAFNIFNQTQFRIYDPDNPGSTGNNIVSCYAGPQYSAGFKGSGADCITGASFLHPVDAHRPRTLQLALKLAF